MFDPGPNEPEKVMNGACEARASPVTADTAERWSDVLIRAFVC